MFSRFFCLLIASGVLVFNVYAIDTYEFNDPVQEKRFQALTKELRCPKCQNQNLADSNAMQAGDLRREIYHMIIDNKSDKEIIDFMVYRYGDFVLYRPKVNSMTYILWFGPAFLIAIGFIVVGVIVRRKASNNAKSEAGLDDNQRSALNKILNKD
jgi:cytochrome c-type biogenesis protein CcmH